jgi:hypothetical protein
MSVAAGDAIGLVDERIAHAECALVCMLGCNAALRLVERPAGSTAHDKGDDREVR